MRKLMKTATDPVATLRMGRGRFKSVRAMNPNRYHASLQKASKILLRPLQPEELAAICGLDYDRVETVAHRGRIGQSYPGSGRSEVGSPL